MATRGIDRGGIRATRRRMRASCATALSLAQDRRRRLSLVCIARLSAGRRPAAPQWRQLARLYARHGRRRLLILWLALLGIRKRAMTRGRWSLKAWTSAHVYLGLALIVIATLHTGFQFGWNVHTLAYVLMMLVIVSGIYGISVYAAAAAGAQRQPLGDDRAADDRRGQQPRQAAPDRRPAAVRRGQRGGARLARRGSVRRRRLAAAVRQLSATAAIAPRSTYMRERLDEVPGKQQAGDRAGRRPAREEGGGAAAAARLHPAARPCSKSGCSSTCR